jgi:hypothetical protein
MHFIYQICKNIHLNFYKINTKIMLQKKYLFIEMHQWLAVYVIIIKK